jgi:serine/threonine-protein kinase
VPDIPTRTRLALLSPGKRLGHFEIRRVLGVGGMGIVYEAQDVRLQRRVALKVLSPELFRDRVARERFMREAQLAASITHPNVAIVHEVDEEAGTPFIAMEFVPGRTIKAQVRSGPLPFQKVLSVGQQVCSALEAAHDVGIVHRDIKSSNIIVTPSSQVKVLDFGLAKALSTTWLKASSARERAPMVASSPSQEETGVTLQGAILGTPSYVSPEQASGGVMDARSDLFSLGVVLYEAASGRLPFQGSTNEEILESIRSQDPTPLRLDPQVPGGFSRVIARCLTKNPEDRHGSAAQLREELDRLEEESKQRPRRIGSVRRRAFLVAGAMVVVLALIGALEFGALRDFVRTGISPTPIRALAVLPFENLSGDPNQEYFADGMTDELISSLATIEQLRVISRTSVMQYKSVNKPLPEIARELDVGGVVAGSVTRAGNRVRIRAQLIQAVTDRHLWSGSYERELDDILALQNGVARAIAREVQATLTEQEDRRLKGSARVNPEAYEAYLKGRYYWNTRTSAGLRKGVGYFERAIEKDPDYAPAYAGLADSYLMMGRYHVLAKEDAYRRARTAATNALRIDSSLAEAQTSIAAIREDLDWDWVGAEKAYRRALELNRSYAIAHHWYAVLLAGQGRHGEAIAEIERARALDPLSLNVNTEVCGVYFFARQYDRAIRECEKAIQIDEDYALAHYYLGLAYAFMERFDEAIAELQKARSLSKGEAYTIAGLGHAYARAGDKVKAQTMLSELELMAKTVYVEPTDLAAVHVGLGANDRAIEYLQKGYVQRGEDMAYLKVEPMWDPLRADPRFIDLLGKMGLDGRTN